MSSGAGDRPPRRGPPRHMMTVMLATEQPHHLASRYGEESILHRARNTAARMSQMRTRDPTPAPLPNFGECPGF
jgi:hypothetical protein